MYRHCCYEVKVTSSHLKTYETKLLLQVQVTHANPQINQAISIHVQSATTTTDMNTEVLKKCDQDQNRDTDRTHSHTSRIFGSEGSVIPATTMRRQRRRRFVPRAFPVSSDESEIALPGLAHYSCTSSNASHSSGNHFENLPFDCTNRSLIFKENYCCTCTTNCVCDCTSTDYDDDDDDADTNFDCTCTRTSSGHSSKLIRPEPDVLSQGKSIVEISTRQRRSSIDFTFTSKCHRLVLPTLLLMLIIEFLSHSSFLCSATESSPAASFQPSEPVEIERLIRGISHTKIKNKNNLSSMVKNKVFYHNRSSVTIPTVATTKPAGKAKPGGGGSTGKTKGAIVNPGKRKPKPVSAASVAYIASPTKQKGKGKAKGKVKGNRSSKEVTNGVPTPDPSIVVSHRDPHNRPKYMKNLPPPVKGEPSYYISTIPIPSTTSSTPSAPAQPVEVPFHQPFTMPWHQYHASSLADSDWKGSNRNPFLHSGFSTSTSRSLSLNSNQFPRSPPGPHAAVVVPPPPALDPLSVLKADIRSSTSPTTTTERDTNNNAGVDDEDDDGRAPKGRSSLEVEKVRSPVYERPKVNSTSSSDAVSPGKLLMSNFFDNFQDHWDDPIAEETRGTAPTVIAPPEPTKPTAPGSSSSGEITGSGATGTGSGSVPSGGTPVGKHGYLNPPTLQNYPPYYHFPLQHPNLQLYHQKNNYLSSHKNANYWPQKLNSYYGDKVTSQVSNIKHPNQHQKPTEHGQGVNTGPHTDSGKRPTAPAPPAHRHPMRPPFRNSRPFPPRPPYLQGRNPHRLAGPVPPGFGRPIPHPGIKHQLTAPPNIHQHQKLQNSFPFQFMPELHPTGPPSNSIEDERNSSPPTGPSPTKTAVAGLGSTASSATDQENSGSELYLTAGSGSNKVTMMDRVSTFYTDYKLLAWGGILLAVSLGALIAVAILYMNNPPTEVVTAKRSLVDRLSDPMVLKFLESLVEGGDGAKGQSGTQKDQFKGVPIETSSSQGQRYIRRSSSSVDSMNTSITVTLSAPVKIKLQELPN